MTIKIISGGQSGADLGGLIAAERYGLIGKFGGWMPRGWITEDGPKPEYEARFRMRECDEPSWDRPVEMKRWEWEAACYRERTKMNAMGADLTLWFSFNGIETSGYRATHKHARSFVWIARNDSRRTTSTPQGLIDYFGSMIPGAGLMDYGIVNIAGNRESKAEGIGKWVERYLSEVFELLGYKEIASS